MVSLPLGTRYIGMKTLMDRSKGYLAIDGKSLWDLMEDDKYSAEDIKSLTTHIKEKRPHLAEAIGSLDAAGKELLDTGPAGRLRTDVDFEAIGGKIQKALEADRVEATLDSSRWASLEWKWQERT